MLVSRDGGVHPVWRGDGRELYYWHGDQLVAVPLSPTAHNAPPKLGEESILFTAPYAASLNTMYDASPKGDRFVIVTRESRWAVSAGP